MFGWDVHLIEAPEAGGIKDYMSGVGGGRETLSRPLRLGVSKTAEAPPLITPNSWMRVGRSHVLLSLKPYPSAIETKGMSTCVFVCVFVAN